LEAFHKKSWVFFGYFAHVFKCSLENYFSKMKFYQRYLKQQQQHQNARLSAFQLFAMASFLFCLISIVDYFLPTQKKVEPVSGFHKERVGRRNSFTNLYNVSVSGRQIHVDKQGWYKMQLRSSFLIFRTPILGKILDIQDIETNATFAKAYSAPFSFFPLFQFFLAFPMIVLWYFKKNNLRIVYKVNAIFFVVLTLFAMFL
jgi:hypothetical protein